jgi:hypothetical protein
MVQSSEADGPTAWIDERRLGRYIGALYGRQAQSLEISLVRLLASEGIGELYRRERYREDGARIGPELKVPLETAALVLEVFAAAHQAALRVMALHDRGDPLRFVRMDDLLGLMLEAGCDPPRHPAA